MDFFRQNNQYQPGEIVYVFYRNPHTQDVTNIQEAAVVRHPDDPNELALFLYETYYPLSDEIAIFPNKAEAMAAYEYFFASDLDEHFDG